MPNLTPSLILNPSLTPPRSRSPPKPCILPPGVGSTTGWGARLWRDFRMGRRCLFHTLVVNRNSWRFNGLFFGQYLKIPCMETAASVHSCVKTALSEMTCMHIFFFLCCFGQIILFYVFLFSTGIHLCIFYNICVVDKFIKYKDKNLIHTWYITVQKKSYYHFWDPIHLAYPGYSLCFWASWL